MKINHLIKRIGLARVPGSNSFEVKGISCNSKTVKNGFVFVAIQGNRDDGSKYIEEAIRNGARAVITKSQKRQQEDVCFIKVRDTRKALARLASEFYGNPSKKIKVVGVTGTNGKTTITYLIEALLKKSGFSPAVIGTINYRFKDKVFSSKNTTPGPVELESMLAEMRERGIDYTAMEVSSHALDQDRVTGINFHSAIFTNLTQDHLDYHRTLEKYFRAKSKLFKILPSRAFAVVNIDDRYGRRLLKNISFKPVTYAIDNKADFVAKDLRFAVSGSEFNIIGRKGFKLNLKSKLIGKHNIYNMLAAVAWAQKEGIKAQVIKEVMENFCNVPGRLEQVYSDNRVSVFVDYAHTEDALKNILNALREISDKRIIVVFGCGGERDKTKRPKMGRIVSELSDYAIITNDNPRSEDPFAIIRDIKKGMTNNHYSVVPERMKAIRKSLCIARKGDIVLVAGKGHENYQILKDRTIHFDDREAVRECLRSVN
ncbi:MAG: UDP-N-acetylmuramoyl-L-alanyl-D-glutamate--2,6-diaminopimelate ligase [Candidatus Omnitrophica bacterium]|nr:UDP-N-acetylmuramoyl-L-alanyl-D-glutamate--2,6-diaminopimelate ligase [Candidatus Omnitrophota bacterium]MBU1870287.1 UDP-N-acetylmuramoyl-L-alanyl-D-glutamate--2,6-diaminopimelate ligase [Candidatus Omnitrophota bacterium]